MKYHKFHKKNLTTLIKRLQPAFDEQTVDFEALWDSGLSVIENYKNILNTINISYAEKDLDLKGLEESATRSGIEQEEKHSTDTFNTELKNLASQEQPNIDVFYQDAYGYLDTVIKGKTNALVIKSEGGLGKTYNILKHLSKRGIEVKYVSGWITKLELYQFLHANQNETIVFDDCEIMLEDDGIIALLKPAIWETVKDKRIVSYISSSEKLTVPKQFIFNGKVIMLINEIPQETRKTVQALLSRAIYYELEFSYQDKIKLMVEIAKMPFNHLTLEERLEVVNFIKENADETYQDLNLRSLMKGLDLRANITTWKPLLKNLLVENEELRLVKEIIHAHPTDINEQIRTFQQKTGKGRSTYYVLKKQLKTKIQKSSHSGRMDEKEGM